MCITLGAVPAVAYGYDNGIAFQRHMSCTRCCATTQVCRASSKPAVLFSTCVPNHLCFARIRSSVVKSASFLYVPRPKSFS